MLMIDPPRRPISIGFLLASDFTLSAFSLFLDHFRLAADEGDGSRPINVTWDVLSSNLRAIRASSGIAINPTSRLGNARNYDYIVVVGGLLRNGADAIGDEEASFLQRAADAGVTLVGLCTGSFILCRLGLMKSRRVCVSWYHKNDFVAEFPHHHAVADQLFVEDGGRITCAGGASTADLAVYLIERHLGHCTAQKANQVLMFDRSRQGHANQPHPPVGQDFTHPKIARALLIMEQHLSAPLSISLIARQIGMSVRQFERLFHNIVGETPAIIYRDIRIRYAHWLLHTTDRSITEIAYDAGFSDCSHFSRHFKIKFGQSPSQERESLSMEKSILDIDRKIFHHSFRDVLAARGTNSNGSFQALP
ncbi:GlxA family transcriptional regulator [Novosphingobium flavum]|uniref:GlxA family transcriptional regulator n=2 Tax=Novosphingobium aerophilum TaxID=2839843 RepID=A0A7X1F996_9SPHN|nr:GlxA family transcriptional regulator [Novosphingobium aerophilum]MBC2660827.1 GlxA family transcriptional regulator [Novosphingobium aerophilum]